MKTIIIISIIYLIYKSINELFYLYKWITKWEYVNWKEMHNIQHMIMVTMILLSTGYIIILTWISEVVLILNLVNIFYVLKHISQEREDGL